MEKARKLLKSSGRPGVGLAEAVEDMDHARSSVQDLEADESLTGLEKSEVNGGPSSSSLSTIRDVLDSNPRYVKGARKKRPQAIKA